MRNILTILAIFLFACLATEKAIPKTDLLTTREDLKDLIGKELKRGSSEDEIRKFFRRHKISYTYDSFANRYQSNIGLGDYHSLYTLIFLDKSRRFLRADVEDTYTAP